MRYLLLTLLILSTGCLQPNPGPVNPNPEPDPLPVVLTPEAAASVFARQYSAALAETSSDLAKRSAAGEFETLADLNDEWVTRSKADRLAAQQAVIDAMNKTLIDERGEKPGTAAATLFEELAQGFRKGAGN